jgi:hypothetical protein
MSELGQNGPDGIETALLVYSELRTYRCPVLTDAKGHSTMGDIARGSNEPFSYARFVNLAGTHLLVLSP